MTLGNVSIFSLGFVAGLICALVLLRLKDPEHPDFTRNISTTMKSAYRVLSGHNGTYVIAHDGHVYTAKCRASLTWLDGTDKPGGAMTDGDCTYMDGKVGLSIGDDLMRKESNSLVLAPWAGADTLQTADYLTIISDEPVRK